MRAGKVPPVTDVSPPIPLSDSLALSLKNATDAASCGTYPLNHADAFCWLVPVLPAAGRPSARAADPVPPFTTLLSEYVRSAITSLLNTSWVCVLPSYKIPLFEPITWATKYGFE